ncbi:MAG: redoxin domain-containing protein [Myxococcota bacterium]
MNTPAIGPGSEFPPLPAANLDGTTTDISKPAQGADWTMVVVYRGQHCPLCTRYLNRLTSFVPRLREIGIHVVAVSGDSKQQLEGHLERLDINFPIHYGLTTEQMQALGVHISAPRSEKETDHPFAEPGLFVINEKGTVQVIDTSNNPFVRPDLEALVSGLSWIRSHDYPIRGTFGGDRS